MRFAHVEHGKTSGDAALHMGLVGRGIALSRTPAMHEAEAAAQGLTCRYDLLDTDAGTEGSLAEIIDYAEAAGFAGLNVTFPYKQMVIEHLHQLSHAAQRIGAVNTIVFRDGRRLGHNTDFWGFSESVRTGLPGVDLSDVLLIGAGGAGGALAHALADMGVGRLRIMDVRNEAAAALAQEVGPLAEAVNDAAAVIGEVCGIVNATPVGMAKLPGTPMDTALLDPRIWVADIIYFPLETALLRAARARGCQTLSGEGMAVFQAVRAFELFTGHPADADRMRATFRTLGES